MIDAIEQFLKEDEWKYSVVGEQNNIIKLGMNGDNGNFECIVFADLSLQRMECFVQCPIKAPQNTRTALSELILRINWPLGIGAFHLDFNDGEVKYKSSIPLGKDGTLTASMARDAVLTSVLSMDRYFPSLMSVIYAGTSPTDALALVRKEE